jgi:hypothetical protein
METVPAVDEEQNAGSRRSRGKEETPLNVGSVRYPEDDDILDSKMQNFILSPKLR